MDAAFVYHEGEDDRTSSVAEASSVKTCCCCERFQSGAPTPAVDPLYVSLFDHEEPTTPPGGPSGDRLDTLIIDLVMYFTVDPYSAHGQEREGKTIRYRLEMFAGRSPIGSEPDR